jgi:hypothetical protein
MQKTRGVVQPDRIDEMRAGRAPRRRRWRSSTISRSRRRPAQIPSCANSDHAVLTFTPTGLSTGMECPPVDDDCKPDSSIRQPNAGDCCARPFLSVAVMLGLAGCAAQVAPSAAYTAPAQTQMAQGEPQSEPQNCHAFTAQVTVGGQPQQAVGQACRQADGSWQVTQNTPGLPQ